MTYINIVKKEWGEERWIVNREYCGKILILKKGYRCSMHYHKKKDETFYINKGKVLLEIDNKKIIMNPGDSQLIRPMQKHRFTGLEDSEIIEFSTHHEDSDSYREELSGKVDLSKINISDIK
ncbi:MAG: cupin domain-containing protein [Candidatus Woesearchaeota archaeon]